MGVGSIGGDLQLIVLASGGITITRIAGTILFQLFMFNIVTYATLFTGASTKRALGSFTIDRFGEGDYVSAGTRVIGDLYLQGYTQRAIGSMAILTIVLDWTFLGSASGSFVKGGLSHFNRFFDFGSRFDAIFGYDAGGITNEGNKGIVFFKGCFHLYTFSNAKDAWGGWFRGGFSLVGRSLVVAGRRLEFGTTCYVGYGAGRGRCQDATG